MKPSAVSPIEKRCAGHCRLIKSVDEFYPTRNRTNGDIIGHGSICKACSQLKWKASRDGLTISPDRVDRYGNLVVPGGASTGIHLFSEAVREEAIKQIKRDRSLQTCADHLNVSYSTFESWLNNEKEPYASWARRFRMARDKTHRKPIVDATVQEAKAGNVRAQEFLLKTGWREEFGDPKEVELTVRRGADEIDATQYSVEELAELRRLLSKGSAA